MPASGPRRRDGAASRERLLRAAVELFADRGFDRTTARDIGERANVDPALIARYFGGKTQLYIEALHAESGTDIPADLLEPVRLEDLLRRADTRGPGPLAQAALWPYDDAEAQQAAIDALRRRMVEPLRRRLAADGDPHPDLRAELLTAAVVGVMLARRSRTLEVLAAADANDVATVLAQLFTPGSRGSSPADRGPAA
jgi:AcrR family transcriptional regulator